MAGEQVLSRDIVKNEVVSSEQHRSNHRNETTIMTEAANQRTRTAIHPKLEKNLAAYFAAAGAAGVGVLGLAQSAQANVVYTPTNVTVTTPIAIDLNHDGIVDFSLGF